MYPLLCMYIQSLSVVGAVAILFFVFAIAI